MTTTSLELLQINVEFLGSSIDGSNLIDSLNSFGRNTKLDISTQLFREESLPLKINMLHLLDPLVGKGNNTSLAIGRLSE